MKALYILNVILFVYIWWAVKLSRKGHVVKDSFRWWGAALLALTVSGCSYNYPYSHSAINTAGGPPPEAPTSDYTVINNSGYPLKVYQDGKYVGDLAVGQVRCVKGTLLWRRTVVSVTAFDNGNYVGADSWIYEFGVPEAWTVTRLNRPKAPR